jgi:hypothetical protein
MEVINALTEVNFLAVVIAAIVQFALGALWYSPLMFAQAWIEDNGFKKGDIAQDMNSMIKRYGATLVLFFFSSWVLAALLTSSATVSSAVNWSLLIGLGLVATLAGVNYLYENKAFRLFMINIGYHVFGLLLAGIIIAAWN